MVSKADLHVHSKYSDRPSEWILRRIGAPESYTEPRKVYDVARRRGMQFVTITDHNCIRGAMEIAHLEGAFVSSEVTTYFPEDSCKIHVLAWNIAERQFAEIQELRASVYELREYLWWEGIPHACAHPLYAVNDRLTVAHIEKLILLFNTFEALNGSRNAKANGLVLSILKGLTRERIEEMADRHAIAPVGIEPWRKGFTGGSDDHCGAFIAQGYTECPDSSTHAEFLRHVWGRRSNAGGLSGTPLSLAHSLYSIGYQYYRDKFLGSEGSEGDAILRAFTEIFGRDQTRVGIRERVAHILGKVSRRKEKSSEVEFKRLISADLVDLFRNDWHKDDYVQHQHLHDELNRHTFEMASKISNRLLFRFSRRFLKQISKGSIFGSIEALSAMGPVALVMSPYLFSFMHHNRDRTLRTAVAERFVGPSMAGTRPRKKAWFTDTLTEVNGVTTLVRKMCQLAETHGHDLTLVSFAEEAPAFPGKVRNFVPVGQFTLPENDTVTLAFPPALEMLEYIDREQFTDLIISTPGLAGLAALAAGKALDLRLIGIYHTDLPQYIRYYTEDDAMESAAWKYLHWFYDQMDVIYVPTLFYAQQLVEKGFDSRRLRLFPHGTDVEQFHPRHCDPDFWSRHSVNGGPKIIYVGRVAKEKDLDILIEVYDRLARSRPDWVFAVVGDGPYLGHMREQLRLPNVVFTGFLYGDDLSKAYASSDLLVFPSTTDTFGNVVLEAMASGVPPVVTDRGGPQEIVQDGKTGVVTPGRDARAMAEAIESMITEKQKLSDMGARCRTYAESQSWTEIYLRFWNDQDDSPNSRIWGDQADATERQRPVE